MEGRESEGYARTHARTHRMSSRACAVTHEHSGYPDWKQRWMDGYTNRTVKTRRQTQAGRQRLTDRHRQAGGQAGRQAGRLERAHAPCVEAAVHGALLLTTRHLDPEGLCRRRPTVYIDSLCVFVSEHCLHGKGACKLQKDCKNDTGVRGAL